MRERLKNVPLQPGVYIYKDRDGKVIYVGKAKVLRNRMRSYFQSPQGLDPKVRAMMARVKDFDFIVTASEVEALILENNLIKAYQPRYNIALRDDKSYPYLKITVAEKFPRILITREKKDNVSKYFGPYTDVTSLKETVRLLTTIFPLRTCKTLKFNRRPCLNRDMGKCPAPCSGQVSPEAYRQAVDGIVDFLEGKTHGITQTLAEEMQKAAAELDFEKAARLRDQIQAIQRISEKQKIDYETEYYLDVIGMITGEKENLVQVFKIRKGKITGKDTFWLKRAIDEDEPEVMEFFLKQYYHHNNDIPGEILVSILPETDLVEDWLRQTTGHKVELRLPQRGDKKNLLDMVINNAALLWEEKQHQDFRSHEALLKLSQALDLELIPERIECFDISHLAGEETVASMVVFTGGMPDRKAYRRFKINMNQNDDFASMAEAVERRFIQAQKGNESFLPEPDLLIIDGGLGQVNAVKSILDKMNLDIPVFGLAKKNEELFSPGRPAALRLPRRHEGLMLLQRVRDEAHRFAITYNRQRRAQKSIASVLDDIPGIGPARKKALLTHFGSVAKIKQASREELVAVQGMTSTAAAAVYDFFHES
ncbi:MAG: excinuclease ABC subunit UvrC [Syntrophomonadaceae bacterium]|jgi:excinuclease ABC subunit C